MKTTAIIILNYNNYEDTINCIKSVEQHNSAPIKLIIVDNASLREGVSQALAEFLKQRYGECYKTFSDDDLNALGPSKLTYCSLILSKCNDGYANGNNKGLKLVEKDTSIEYVMILNNDVLFVEDIIPKLVERNEKISNAALLSPLLYKRNMKEYDCNCARIDTTFTAELLTNFFHYLFHLFKLEMPWLQKRYILRKYNEFPKCIPIELPSGSCMFIKKSVFKEIGYFDPNTFLYYEENILYRKVKQVNRMNYLFTDLKCIHLGAQSTSKVNYSHLQTKKNVSSAMYYMKNYYGLNRVQYAIYHFSILFYIHTIRMRKLLKFKR